MNVTPGTRAVQPPEGLRRLLRSRRNRRAGASRPNRDLVAQPDSLRALPTAHFERNNTIHRQQNKVRLRSVGVRLSNHLWVREVRHLTEKGHQSSILSTDYRSDLSQVAGSRQSGLAQPDSQVRRQKRFAQS